MKRNPFYILFFAALASVFVYCKNDPKTDAGTDGTGEEETTLNEGGKSGDGKVEEPVNYPTDAKEISSSYSDVYSELERLSEEIGKIDPEVKANVKDFDELMNRIDGFSEKSSMAAADMEDIQKGKPGDADAAADSKDGAVSFDGSGSGASMEDMQKTREYGQSISQMQAELEIIQKAVEKLKNAPNKGKGLVLFDGK